MELYSDQLLIFTVHNNPKYDILYIYSTVRLRMISSSSMQYKKLQGEQSHKM